MVRMKMSVGVFASALCLCLCVNVFAGLVDSEVAAINDGQELKTLFMGEKNPYRRLDYFSKLPSVLQRFGITGKEAWVDQMIDKALDDPWEDVVFAALRSIGSMNKTQFTDKLIALYSSADGRLALSESPVRCMIIRSLKGFPGAAVSSFLASVVKNPPHQDQTSEIIRESLSAIRASNNPVFIEPLTFFSQSLGSRKAGFERELDALPQAASPAEEKSGGEKRSRYNRRIQGYAEMIASCDDIINSLSGIKGDQK